MPNGLGNLPANRMDAARGAGAAPSLADQAAAARAAGVKTAPDAGGDKLRPRPLPPLTETEYQRFIRETTGRKLSLYGYNLFEAGAFPSLQNVPVPADYVVGPGDELRVRLWGAVDVDLSLTVDRNGQITIPRVGTLNVAGLKSSQLEPTLKAQVGRIFSNFQLNATLGQLRSMQVFVVGQARQPGAYNVSSLSSLISVLFESGGPAATGSMRNIQLKRDGQLVSTIDLYKFITLGDKSADARLLPGDVIVIAPAGPRVALIGMLDTPAVYELGSAEEPLSQLLAYAGGVLSLTTQHKVLVERINSAQIKAPRSVEERTLDAAGLASAVRDGDVVTLFKIKPEFANAVTLRGNVAVPVRHVYRAGMRVSDLIPDRDALIQPDYYTRKNLMVQFESGADAPGARLGRTGAAATDPRGGRAGADMLDVRSGRAGTDVSEERVALEIKNLLQEINWDYAVVERLDVDAVRSTLIPFNLGRAVLDKNPADNLELRAGDVVTIFGVNDLPVPMEKRTQFVRIAGEVKIPGIYQIQPGELLTEVVMRAGGLSANAYLYGMVFSRESTRIQQQANLDRAIRRMEADLGSRSATALQNLSDVDKGMAQAQLETQRQTLARLQSLKASGRIALEMDPANPELPPITLEDGDQIMVPNRPSFVGVFGAVMAETSFLHRPGYTVADYIDRAGMTAEAEEDATLLVRADGSVESNQAIRSWFTSGSSFMRKALQPGDVIFVPERLDRRTAYTRFIQGAKDWTSIMFQFGLGAAAIKTLR
jgi:protein involved in polysaccharide export with SLBB domain